MKEKKAIEINCAKCKSKVCRDSSSKTGGKNCPTRTEQKLIKSLMKRYKEKEFKEFVRIASVLEGMSYQRVAWSEEPSPLTSRLEEIIRFAAMMGYKKLGVAFCVGLANEAEILVPLLEKSGFGVVSVCCKVGAVSKEDIGIKDAQKIYPGRYESMCNPIAQAEILNREKCDFNIMVGLCVGHDSLFLKHVKAPTTVFAVKDRLLGHNPLAALYLSDSYYRRLKSPDLSKKLVKKKSTESR